MRHLAACCVIGSVLSVPSITTVASAESPLWVRQIGSAGDDSMTGIARGAEDSLFMAASFSGTIDLDPEAGVFELTSIGTTDVYVTRFDRDGRLVWAAQLGGSGSTASALTGSIASVPGNVIYVSGVFNGTIDFDPGPGVFEMTSSAGGDIYVVKLSDAGQLAWARQMTCSSGGAGPLAIAADAAAIHFTGTMGGTCDFDPGPETADLTMNAGEEDFFIARLDAAGDFGWAAAFGSTGSDIPNGITVDAGGNVYTVGRARGAIDYDPGPGTDMQTGDFFVIKQSPIGAEQWSRAIGTGSLARAFGVATDAGGVYVTGQYANTVDFDPGPGTAQRTATAGLDGFALKLDPSGAFAWVVTIGGTVTDQARRAAIGPDGKVRVVGQFYGTVDFDPGAGTSNLTSAGGSDGFVLTLDGAGRFVGALALGGVQSDAVIDLVSDQGGNVIAFGRFAGSADFDPGPGTLTLTSAGGTDAFVWKYGLSELHLTATAATPTSIAFSPGSPASFDVVKGALSDLRATGSYSQASCLGVFVANPATDAAIPPAGDGFYYLARGRDCCSSEGYGDSTLAPDPRDALDLQGLCP